MAATAEPTYKADPSVYKLIFEDANFRVIEATHPKGVRDEAHSHAGPFLVYNLTDCAMKTTAPMGRQLNGLGTLGRFRCFLQLLHTRPRIPDRQTVSRFLSRRSSAAFGLLGYGKSLGNRQGSFFSNVPARMRCHELGSSAIYRSIRMISVPGPSRHIAPPHDLGRFVRARPTIQSTLRRWMPLLEPRDRI